MGKTIYIQIDNNFLPEGCGEDVEVLDCRCINDFCSLVGDALVGDLKDENDKPLYRLINPVGRLLIDFEKVDKISYDQIIAQWLDIFGEMLHKKVTQCDGQFTILFPRQYVDWLLCNETDYYVEIGKYLQSNEGKVFLDADGISEDIISALHMKIRRFLNDNKDNIEYIVFSNERIGNSSYVVKQLRSVFKSYSFLRLEQWEKILQEEQQRRIENLEDHRIFRADRFILGVSRIEEYGTVRDESCVYYHRGYLLKFKGGTLCRISVESDHTDKEYQKAFDRFLSIIMGKQLKRIDANYNIIFDQLHKKGFHDSVIPHIYESEYFSAVLTKELPDYKCVLNFFQRIPLGLSLSLAQNKRDTLKSISVELK